MKCSFDIFDFFLTKSPVFPILLFSSIFLHCSLKRLFVSPCYSLELCIQLGISFPISLAFRFSFFLNIFALFTEEDILSFLTLLWDPAFSWVYLSLSPLLFTSLLFSAICKVSSDYLFAFLHFFFLIMFWSLPPLQSYEPLSIVLQAIYQF